MVESFVAAMHEVRTHPLLLALLVAEPETILPLLTVKASLGLAFARACLVVREAALFVLFPASAGTRLVAADLSHAALHERMDEWKANAR